jgi:hypothetical protein
MVAGSKGETGVIVGRLYWFDFFGGVLGIEQANKQEIYFPKPGIFILSSVAEYERCFPLNEIQEIGIKGSSVKGKRK